MSVAASLAPQRAAPDLADAVALCLSLRGIPKSAALVRQTLPPDSDEDATVVAGLSGLGVEAAWCDPGGLPADVAPAVVRLADGRAAVLLDFTADAATVRVPGLAPEHIARDAVARILLLKGAENRDRRADDLVADSGRGWFWPVLWAHRRYFGEAAALSAVVNILGLAGIVFMMTVYDRVLPNQTFVTLWSLAAGVGVAMLFELLSRTLRGHVLDGAGKKIDLVLGDAVFSRVLTTRLEHRAASSGAFANVLKEFESVRGFVTSASLTAVADLPFALLFLAVTALIAGPLVWVPLAAFAAVLALSLAVQPTLARYASEGLREGAVRHGTVIESLEGLETLKALSAEPRMRDRHVAASAKIAAVAVESQATTNFVIHLTTFIQQAAGVALLVWGVYLAASGDITGGALIAAFQLNSRALAPLVSLSSLATRFQSARSAMKSLDKIMALPVERDAARDYLSGEHWQGGLEARGVSFAYAADAPPVLSEVSLKIAPGERIAVLGRQGSGKSTLLRLLASLYRPTAGQILMDGVDLSAIEPGDVRRTVALVGQDARLFHGTLRENLRIAAPRATDADLLALAERTGVTDIAAAHPLGFDRPVGERGDTLSGGQRQAVALTRMLLARPKLLLLDEPTSAMDQKSEAEVMALLAQLPRDTGIVLVTHKQAVLGIVDRIVVIDGGRVVADGPKSEILARLAQGLRSAA
jgi:ATP-binding cassette subfamily C protein LapB